MNSENIRRVCEYIFESEETDFINHVKGLKDIRKITLDERDKILEFISSGNVSPSPLVRSLLMKINHVYAHAILAYSDTY